MRSPHAYPQAIVCGPSSHGGIGSIDLKIEQGIMIINEVARTIQKPGHGQDILLCIFLCIFQHASGLLKSLLGHPNQRTPHLKGYYYAYLREFLAENKIQTEFACVDNPKPEQENGQLIMY